MSGYGQLMAERFTHELVKQGWVIVSGLARGVDRVAHETCLNLGGRTIAVLAHGVDLCYPPEHAGLKQRILDSGGLLVSEYAEGRKPTPDKFRRRDRLMVKLAQAVLVVESPRKSGVKITVREAAETGKDVFVITGPLTQESYYGSVEIIRDGGIPVYNPQDLIEQLGYTESI